MISRMDESELQSILDDKTSTASPFDQQNQPRQRLRSWLSQQLDHETCPGCKWINKDMKVFQLTWKHYGRPGFDEERDAKMFREWARHTKRYTPGDPSDVSTWKTRFRNALHKMPDIEEMSDYHQLDGNEPYRVYRFRTPEEMEKLRKSNEYIPSPMSNYIPLQSPVNCLTPAPAYSPPPYNNTPTPKTMPDLPKVENEIDRIKNYLKKDATSGNNMNGINTAPQLPAQVPTQPWNEWNDLEDVVRVLADQTKINQNNNQTVNTTTQYTDPPPLSMQEFISNSDAFNTIPMQAIGVKLFFAEKEVYSEICANPNGVRIAYKPPHVPSEIVNEDGAQDVLISIYGPISAKQIYYPYVNDDLNTSRILSVFERGLVLEMESNGDMYATRLCIARVFYSDHMLTPPKALVRSQRTLVFSFHNDFLPSLAAYRRGCSMMIPSCERYFSIGQQWNNQHDYLKDVFVHCSVTHFLAKKLLTEAKNENSSFDVEKSVPNYVDDLKTKLENIVLSNNSLATNVNHNNMYPGP